MQAKKLFSLPKSTSGILKHSLKVITCAATMALLSISSPMSVKADPPGRLAHWSKTFEDNFDNGFDTSKWSDTFWWGNGSIGDGSISYYSPDNVSVSNGYLNLSANNSGDSYTGATVNTYKKFYQTYGYFEARVKVPKGSGLGPYFLLSSEDTSWPPEIDIFEIPGAAGRNATKLWMTNRYLDTNGNATFENSGGTWTASSGLDEDYHTYGLLWRRGLLIWYVDGVERYRTTVGVPDKDCYISLGNGVGDDAGSWNGNPTNTIFPQYMSVDWIRAWAWRRF